MTYNVTLILILCTQQGRARDGPGARRRLRQRGARAAGAAVAGAGALEPRGRRHRAARIRARTLLSREFTQTNMAIN